MKMYVDELPKDCLECVCLDHSMGCNFRPTNIEYDKRPKDCPLQPLAEYTKQVRKETIEEVLQTINNNFNCLGYIEDIKFEEFKKKLLDKIQGENNE